MENEGDAPKDTKPALQRINSKRDESEGEEGPTEEMKTVKRESSIEIKKDEEELDHHMDNTEKSNSARKEEKY